jgi:tyrosine-protein kinase Etk/Wzc
MNKETFDPYFFEEEKNDANIKEVTFKHLSYWKWFACSFVLALIVAFFYLKLQTPQYKIQSSIQIKEDKKDAGQDDLIKQLNMFTSEKGVDNEIEVLKSFTLMDKVVTALNLNVHYFEAHPPVLTFNGFPRLNFNPRESSDDYFRDKELYNQSPVTLEVIRPNALLYEKPLEITIVNPDTIKLNGVNIPLNKAVETPYGLLNVHLKNRYTKVTKIKVMVQPPDVFAESLIGNLKIEPSSKVSAVLLMSINDPVKQRGCDILNKLIDFYNLAKLEDKNKVATSTLVIIEDRLKMISQELGDVEKNVEHFKSGNQITDISEESRLFLNSVQDNDIELNKIKIQQQVLDEISKYVHSKGFNTGTAPSTLGISEPVLLSLITQLVELENKQLSMSKTVKSDNPMLLSINDQVAALRQNIDGNIVSQQKSLAITRQQYEDRNTKMESMLRTIPGKERLLVDISRQQSIKNNLYLYLLQKREETALSFSSAESDSRTIDIPHAGNQPVSPKTNLIYLVFAIIGLAVPFSTIKINDLFNDKILRRKDIIDATGATILGEISYTDHDDPLAVTNTGSVFAEQVRSLRTNLPYISSGKSPQSILFTSSISGEGKSFIAINLGASLAMMNKKTIILDFDLRKPMLNTLLNIDNTKGISNYLMGQVKLDEIIFPVIKQPNLSIISSGPIQQSPVELMVNGRLEDLIAALREKFDYIIIDAPPIGIVTDAQVLVEHADATLYVLRHDYTPKSYLKFFDSLYKGKKFKHMNLIFNGVKEGGRYGYEYGAGYGNGYGYTNRKAKKGLFGFLKKTG